MLNQPRADQAAAFFGHLKLTDVYGHPRLRDAAKPWTLDLVREIFGAYDEETRKQMVREFFVLVPKKNSKALALDTPIPTPTGWTTMGKLQTGDKVFGADGKPCTVIDTSPIYHDHDCYELTFSNEQTVIADAGHLWFTHALLDKPASGSGNHGDIRQRCSRIRTTKEIADTLLRPGDGARNHSIDMPEAIQCCEKNLPIPPYTLGAWLGDGHSSCARITTMDDEVIARIRADGYTVDYRSNNGSRASTYLIGKTDRSKCKRGHDRAIYGRKTKSGFTKCVECERQLDHEKRNGTLADPVISRSFTDDLRSLDLIENKHIPEQYFRASAQQRLALLQGLMDTDGSINKSGKCITFVGANERLVRDVAALLATFGIKYSLIERPAACNGKPCGTAWHLQFSVFRDDIDVFCLFRKLSRMRARDSLKMSIARSRRVQITEAKKVRSVPVKCIVVDSIDHQFLFGETMLPTHNSTTSAGIMLTAMLLNERTNAEMIILAPTVEIARNAYDPLRGMIKEEPELNDLFRVQDHVRTITHRITGATLKVVAADSETVGGIKASVVLIDELWLFGKRKNSENMLREATGGLVSRPEGFVIYLTTQSDEPPAGVFASKLKYARDVRDGRVKDSQFFPLLYEFPQQMLRDESWRDPENWGMVNPNIGASVDIDYLKREYQKAEHDGEASMRGFAAKHLNVEIGVALQTDSWAGAEFWDKAARDIATLDDLIALSEVCVVGIDGGGLDDLLGLAVIGREKTTRKWLLWTHAWAHEIALERRKSIAPALRDFEKDGNLTVVKTPGDDVKGVCDVVARLRGLLPQAHAIGVDPAGIGAVVDELVNGEARMTMDQISAVPQGWKLNGAIKTAERVLAGGDLVHGGQRMMAWCAGNARVTPAGNAVTITKQQSGTAKIDPLMAMFNAVSLMALNPAAQRRKLVMMTLG